MRQSGTVLPFVTLTELADSTEVHISTTGVEPGQYELALESFNLNSAAQSTLMTDRFTITINATPSFVSELEDQSIYLSSGGSWVLPEIVEGSDPLAEIKVEPSGDALADYITFDPVRRAIDFKKDDRNRIPANKVLPIKITLIDVKGVTSEFVVNFLLFVSEEESSSEELPSFADSNSSEANLPSTADDGRPNEEALKGELSLEERLKDLGSFYATELEQRQRAKEAAAASIDDRTEMPPELRLGRISSYRAAMIEFTNEMNFPNIADFIELNGQLNQSLLDVKMISGETGSVDPNLLSWTITKVTSKKIEIDLVFDKPLEVSQGD